MTFHLPNSNEILTGEYASSTTDITTSIHRSLQQSQSIIKHQITIKHAEKTHLFLNKGPSSTKKEINI